MPSKKTGSSQKNIGLAPKKPLPLFTIAIGVFTGIPDALKDFLRSPPGEMHPTAIIITNLSSLLRESSLFRFIENETSWTAATVINGQITESNTVYIAPAGVAVNIEKARIMLCGPVNGGQQGLFTNQLFHSLALDAGQHSVGIVFSNFASAQATGLKEIENAGGLAIVHDGKRLINATSPTVASLFQPADIKEAIWNFQQGQSAVKKVHRQKKQPVREFIGDREIKNIMAGNGFAAPESASTLLDAIDSPLKIKEFQLSESGEQLKANQLKYKSIFDHLPNALLINNAAGQITGANLAACKLFGYTEKELTQNGWRPLIIYPAPGAEKIPEHPTKPDATGELTGIKKNGRRFRFQFSCNAYTDNNDEPGTCTVITGTSSQNVHSDTNQQLPGLAENILHTGRVKKDINGLPEQSTGISKDITDDRELRESLEQNAYFKGAFDNSAIGMALIGVDGTWKEVNDSLCKIVGYTKEELKSLTFQDITHPDDLRADLQYLDELVAGKRDSYQMEKRYFHKNGNTVRILLVVSMVKDRDGKVLHFISQIEDITNRKNIEDALHASEEKYKLLFYSSPLPKWIYDIETFRILDVNEQAVAIYGYNREEFLNMKANEFRATETIPEVNAVNAHHKKGLIRFGIAAHRKKNGDVIKMEISGHPIRFNNRNCMIVVCYDVTEKQAAEEALQLSNERYEYVTKATYDGIWDWDLKRDEVYWGGAFQTLFGYDAGYLAADKNSWSKLIHPDDLQRVYKGILALIDSPENIWSDEYRYLKSNGEYAFVADRGLVLRNELGQGIRMIGAMQDITRKKGEEQQLKLFESVITNTNDGVLITRAENFGDAGPDIIFVNKAFINMTGYAREEAIGKSPAMLLGPRSGKKALFRLQQAIAKKENCDIEIITYKKNGEEFWVNFSIVPMSDEKGWISHWIAIAKDITGRKRKEAEKEVFFNLVQSLGKLELGKAWANILEGICTYAGFEYGEAWMPNIDRSELLLHKRWAKDAMTKKLVAADKVIRIKKGQGLTGQAWEQNKVTYENDITANPDFLSKKFALENKLNSAAYIPVLFKGQPVALLGFYSQSVEKDNRRYKILFDNIGQQLGPYVQNKRAEDELARFFNLSPDLLAISGTDGYFKKINPSFSRVLGYTEKELLDQPITIFMHPDDRQVAGADRKKPDHNDPLFNFDNRYLTKDGETRWLSWTSTSLMEEGIIFAVAKDITALKKADERLHELNNSLKKRAAELAESNNELERFAYVASHDLQEPLRMVSSFLQLLERKYKDKLDETARKYINFSVDGAERMKRLISDLLQYSRIGTAALEILPVDMNEVLAEVRMLFKNEVNTIDAEIIVNRLPVIFTGKSAVTQLMQNLVGNALKYRSEEKTVVTISAEEKNDEWLFTIEDNGIGIESKFKEKIFIIFQRLHNKDEFKGTGIGLAICKKIIERYHGKIWVESEVGKGSKFIFTIPKKISDTGPGIQAGAE